MKKSIIFIAALFFSGLATAELNLELPDMNLPNLGGQGSGLHSSFSEREYGLKVLRNLRGHGRTLEDPELNVWIRSLGNKLASNAPQASTPFYFVIVNDPSVNAFATIGGVIVINSGLILETESESELAAVIAHEIAHITQRHIIRMLEKSEGDKFSRGAVLLAGLIAGSKNAEAGQAILSTAAATMIHKKLAFNREAEAEADRVGLRILARAGFDPKAMPSFLEKLEQDGDRRNASYQEFLRNHPLTIKRVTDTQIRARAFGAYKGRSNRHYFYMKEKLRYLTRSTQMVRSLPKQVKKYAAVLQLVGQKNYQRAYQMIGSSSKVISEVTIIGQLLNKQQQYDKTIKLLQPMLNIYLGNEGLSIILARAYMADGQPDRAWRVIKDIHASEQSSLEFFEVKQKVAHALGFTAEAYFAAAERNIRMGNYKAATTLLHQGIKAPGGSASILLAMQRRLVQFNNKKN